MRQQFTHVKMFRLPPVWLSTHVRHPFAKFGTDVTQTFGYPSVPSLVSHPPPVAVLPAGQVASTAVHALLGMAVIAEEI
jgi:hypothetical protein